MPPVLTNDTQCQTSCFFDNDVIPMGAPRSKLPWAYAYAQFAQLLQAYPEVHPEDFVTFGILQKQPRCRLAREWGEVAGVLSHMMGGRQTFVTKLTIIVNRIQHLDCTDPMRALEERTLVDVLLKEHRRSRVPLEKGAFDFLAAPGGPMAPPTQPGPTGAPHDPRRRPPPSSITDPQPSPSGAQGGPGRPPSLQPGPSGTQGERQHTGPPPRPSGAQGGTPRPPPGFETVDRTADVDTGDEEIDESPATPKPQRIRHGDRRGS